MGLKIWVLKYFPEASRSLYFEFHLWIHLLLVEIFSQLKSFLKALIHVLILHAILSRKPETHRWRTLNNTFFLSDLVLARKVTENIKNNGKELQKLFSSKVFLSTPTSRCRATNYWLAKLSQKGCRNTALGHLKCLNRRLNSNTFI